MPRPFLPVLTRIRPSKTYAKYLKYAWKPPPTREQIIWGRSVAKLLRRNPDLRPDGYMRLSDLNPKHRPPNIDFNVVRSWVRNDHNQRFELSNESERLEGQHRLQPTWFIRIRSNHTVPGVNITTKQVTNAKLISSLVFATTPENWPEIEKHGLRPETPNLHPPFRHKNQNCIYFAQDIATLLPKYFSEYPAPNNTPDDHLVQLHININVAAAMNAGIKFFRNRYGQIISTGLPKDKSIPFTFFNNVFVVALKREMMLDAQKHRKFGFREAKKEKENLKA